MRIGVVNRKEEWIWLRGLKDDTTAADTNRDGMPSSYLSKDDYEAIGTFIQTVAELIVRLQALGITREENLVELIKTYYKHNFGAFEEDDCQWP
jgi:hypothetical protein